MNDAYFRTQREALTEAMKRKVDAVEQNMMIKVEQSRYGGFRVRSFPADLYVDQLADGPGINISSNSKTLIGA